jgi:hypothetical protein
MDILYHRDSKWAPGDFNLPVVQPEQPERSFPQPIPMFLEPTHHPQMRMPSTQFSWSLASLASHSINPAVLSTYTGYSSMESSPLVSTPARFDYLPTSEDLAADQSSTITSSSSSFGYDSPAGVPTQTTGDILAQDHARATTEPSCSSESGGCKDYLRLPVPSHQISTYQAMPWNSYLLEGSSEALNVSRTLSLPRILMLSSVKRHDLNETCADTRSGRQENERIGLLEQGPLPLTCSVSPYINNQANIGEAEIEPAGRCAPGGPFIHAICGKGFASRYKVRKHHWGAKNDDMATTTGCWAKHGKPSSNWNDHDSCKLKPAKGRAAKTKETTTVHRGPSLTASGAGDDSTSQAWAEAPKMVPGFPTLQHLPQTVAAALKTHGGNGYLHSGGSQCYARHGVWGECEDALMSLDASLGVEEVTKCEERDDSVMSAHNEAAEQDRTAG